MVEKTINYLWKISDYLDKHVPSAENVSRFLREKCALSKGRSGCGNRMPHSTFDSSSLCPSCFTPWTRGFYKLKFLHLDSKKKKKQSMLKLLSKEPNTLNQFQAALVARAKSGPHSSMRITCLKCSKVTKTQLRKKLSVDQSVEIKLSENFCSAATELVTLPKKKKKKKKDRFCGLNQYAVSSIKKVNDHLSNPTNSICEASKNRELSTPIKPNKHKNNDLNKIKSNVHNNQLSANISNNDMISTSNCILGKNNSKPTSKNLYDKHLNSHKKLNQSNNSVITTNGHLDSHSRVDLDLSVAQVDISDVKTNNRSISPSTRSSSNYKRKEIKGDKSKNYLESCNTSNKGEHKKLKNDCDSKISSVSFPNESELQIKLKGNKTKEPKVSSTNMETSNKGIKKIDSKNNLFSQPKLNSIIKNNKPLNNESQINQINLTDSKSTFQKDSKNIDKNKKLGNNNNYSTNNKLNNISTSNKLQLSQNDKKKKKKSKKTKMKGSKSSQNGYKVFERTNCTNSLCVNDLLSLT